MGVLFCLLAILSFSGLYLVVGQSQKRGIDAMGLNFAAFCAGAVLSVAALPPGAASFPARLALVGAGIGIAAGLGLLATTLAVRCGVGLSVATTTVSLSLVVPILLSLALYGEGPAPRKWIGLVLAAGSILLIQGGKR
jgi:drug/metabolite transporter (DMT)-like permease